MIKVNVANYIIHDLSKRFPMQNDGVVDKEIIDVLIERWSNRHYITPDASVKKNHPQIHDHLYLM